MHSYFEPCISLWRQRPRLLNNPIILRELRDRLRKKSSMTFLLIFLLAGFITFLFIWPFILDAYFRFRVDEARMIFHSLHLVEGIVILIFAPLLGAAAINIEYEKETWELLSTTPISLASIILGKFLSSVFFIWILFISLLPIYSVSIIAGGVSPYEILFIFLVGTELIIISALIGMACSIFFKRTIQSISMTYIFLVLYFLGLLMLPAIIHNFDNSTIYQLILAGSPFFLAIHEIVGGVPGNIPNYILQNIEFFHLVWVIILCWLMLYMSWLGLRLKAEEQWVRIHFNRKNKKIKKLLAWTSKKRTFFPDNRNPLLIKESHELHGRHGKKLWTSFIFLFILGLIIFLNNRRFGLTFEYRMRNLCLWVFFLTPCFVLPFAANSVRGELDRSTWNMLRTTTLTRWSMYMGKWSAGFKIFLWRFIAFMGFPITIFIILFSFSNKHSSVTNLVLMNSIPGGIFTIFLSACFCLSLGMLISMYAKSTLTAYMGSFAAILIFYLCVPFVIMNIPNIMSLYNLYDDYTFIASLLSPFIMLMQWFKIEVNFENEVLNQLYFLNSLVYIFLTLLCIWFGIKKIRDIEQA